MNKIKYIISAFIVVAVSALIIVGCRKETTIDQNLNNITDSDGYVDPTDDILFYNNVGNSTAKDVSIFKISLFRKSRNCNGGFGICRLEILWMVVYKTETDSLPPSREIIYEIDTNQKFGNLTLLLATDVSDFKPDELDLYVDEDIYGHNDDFSEEVFVPQGVYRYNPKLGEYGGYVVEYTFRKI